MSIDSTYPRRSLRGFDGFISKHATRGLKHKDLVAWMYAQIDACSLNEDSKFVPGHPHVSEEKEKIVIGIFCTLVYNKDSPAYSHKKLMNSLISWLKKTIATYGSVWADRWAYKMLLVCENNYAKFLEAEKKSEGERVVSAECQ